MLKVITIFTGRYRKVLKKGDQDKIRLLFRSLAIFDRRSSMKAKSEEQKSTKDGIFTEQDLKDLAGAGHEESSSSALSGFAVDVPANDDEEEDDDDLALAALDALDAIEVFKHDQKTDRKISHANIPASNLKRLVELLLTMTWLSAQENLASYSQSLNTLNLARLDEVSECIIQAFDPDADSQGISYQSFINTVMTSVPHLFEPLSPLFERFLFSKNLDLSRHRDSAAQPSAPSAPGRRPQILGKPDEQGILDAASLAQLNIFLHLPHDIEFHPLYSTNSSGTSLSSFSRQVLSWQSASVLLLKGTTPSSAKPVTLGAYLPEQWKNAAAASRSSATATTRPPATMFQLSPRHAVFRGNASNKTLPVSYFSSSTGIALGCAVAASSRTHGPAPVPALGPVGLLIDADIRNATFQHDGDGAGVGAFMPDARLEAAQRSSRSDGVVPAAAAAQPRKMEIEIDVLEVWGINVPDDSGGDGGEDEATRQRKRLAWDEAEAARRRGVNFGGDAAGARALLEMAGIVGEDSGRRTGGSV